jgi:putative FmdB family regulatory protein
MLPSNSLAFDYFPGFGIIKVLLRRNFPMPLYEYCCSQCGKCVEIVQKVGDPPPKKCKSCGGALKKVISAPAIQFKGNGWYVTDYAKKTSPQNEEKPQEKTEEKAKSKEGAPSKSASEKPSPASSKD